VRSGSTSGALFDQLSLPTPRSTTVRSQRPTAIAAPGKAPRCSSRSTEASARRSSEIFMLTAEASVNSCRAATATGGGGVRRTVESPWRATASERSGSNIGNAR